MTSCSKQKYRDFDEAALEIHSAKCRALEMSSDCCCFFSEPQLNYFKSAPEIFCHQRLNQGSKCTRVNWVDIPAHEITTDIVPVHEIMTNVAPACKIIKIYYCNFIHIANCVL